MTFEGMAGFLEKLADNYLLAHFSKMAGIKIHYPLEL